jgi:hypothetical protein
MYLSGIIQIPNARQNLMADTILLKHGTRACNAEHIQTGGFRPGCYFTDAQDIAEYYAEEAMEACDCEDWRVITVSVPKEGLEADLHSYAAPLSYFRNTYTFSECEWFEMIDVGDVPYPASASDFKTSLDVVRSVRQSGAVPADSVIELL